MARSAAYDARVNPSSAPPPPDCSPPPTTGAATGAAHEARPLIVAAAIVDDLHHPRALLAARRSAPKSLAGRWEFPGGKIEPGEAPREALTRELAEELGVAVRLGDRVSGPERGWPVANGYRMHVWFAQVTGGSPAPLQDHDELRWLPLPEAYTVPWLEPDVPILEAMLGDLDAFFDTIPPD